MSASVFAAIDIGASSGRVMAGRVGADGAVELEVVHRFPNGVERIDGYLRWNLTRLLHEVRTGLAAISAPTSIGISTWGVDYGLLDEHGNRIDEPISYRDSRTDRVIERVHAAVSPRELYAVNGLQFLPFTTLYQLVADRERPGHDFARHAVLLPDLIAHELTGVLRTEVTNASTTGLLDAGTRTWSGSLFDRLGVRADLFPLLDRPGDERGRTADGVPVVTVGSHDTASAVVGVPADTDRFAYVASGTWSLVGLELDRPVLTDAARAANFTNEGGVDGRTRFLRNVGGLWLLQECLRSWGIDDLDRLLGEAAAVGAGGPVFDVDAPEFIAPGRMPERIAAAVGVRMDRSRTVRCILDSLAAAYAETIDRAVALTERPVEVIHVVGGGSQNTLLCQLTADAAGRTVVAGPVEATARGNVVVQARAVGLLPPTLDEIRAEAAATTPLRRYEPR